MSNKNKGGRPATRMKPNEQLLRALQTHKLDGRTKPAKQIKQNIEDFRADPRGTMKADLENDAAVNMLMKEVIAGYLINNADALQPDEMSDLLKRLNACQSTTIRAYTAVITSEEEQYAY